MRISQKVPPLFLTVKTDLVQQSDSVGVKWGSMALPSFHTMGIFKQLYAPLTSGTYIGCYTPKEPEPPVVPTADNILQAMKITGCNATLAVPSIIEV